MRWVKIQLFFLNPILKIKGPGSRVDGRSAESHVAGYRRAATILSLSLIRRCFPSRNRADQTQLQDMEAVPV